MHSGLKTLSVTVQYYIHYRQTNKDGFTELSLYYLHVLTCIEIHTYVQVIKIHFIPPYIFITFTNICVLPFNVISIDLCQIVKRKSWWEKSFQIWTKEPKGSLESRIFFLKYFTLKCWSIFKDFRNCFCLIMTWSYFMLDWFFIRNSSKFFR